MQRLTTTLRLGVLRPSATAARTTPSLLASVRNTSNSAPKSSEGASAESGGSRSKSAAENAATSDQPGGVPDSLSDGSDLRGRTGGGKPLASSRSPPERPKVWSHDRPDTEPGKGLTEEQKEEVEAHNRDFDKKHDHANLAEDDRVDKSFWERDAGSKQ